MVILQKCLTYNTGGKCTIDSLSQHASSRATRHRTLYNVQYIVHVYAQAMISKV